MSESACTAVPDTGAEGDIGMRYFLGSIFAAWARPRAGWVAGLIFPLMMAPWLGAATVPLLASLGKPSTPDFNEGAITDVEASEIAVDAWLFGYPLVTMELTRRAMTRVARPEGKQAPMGQWAHVRTYAPPEVHAVPAPNIDTLYTMAWVDLSGEPYVLGIPDANGRFYMLPVLDAWTNVCAGFGTRVTGGGAQAYALTGPGWNGALPAGTVRCPCPTNIVWLLGRVDCRGTPAEYAAAHAFQDGLRLVPLSAFGPGGRSRSPSPGGSGAADDDSISIRDRINAMDPADYFALMAALMKQNPPTAEDVPMLRRMAKIGMVAGRDFNLATAEPMVAQALREAPRLGFSRLVAHGKSASVEANGWSWFVKLGRYGTDYLHRAFTAAIGVGANLPEDAVYPVSETGADGEPLDGAHRYILHFERGNTPPVNGFWTLALYDGQYFFAPNSAGRYTIGSRDRFRFNADGSLDIHIAHDPPTAGWESNWLPAPRGAFVLMLRLYWARTDTPSILDGTWQPPGVRRVR